VREGGRKEGSIILMVGSRTKECHLERLDELLLNMKERGRKRGCVVIPLTS